MNTEIVQLIKDNEGLIYSIIKKYCQYYDIEDLYQVASIGVIKAYKKYKATYNTKFSTFVYTYILGEVYKYINSNKVFKFNRDMFQLYKKISEAKTLLTQKLMKEPSVKELSMFLEIEESLIEDVLVYYMPVESFEKKITEDNKTLSLSDVIPDNNDQFNIDSLYLHQELDKLPEEEKQLLLMRYFNDQTQSEVANYFGINQVQASRTEKKVLKKLKESMLHSCSKM